MNRHGGGTATPMGAPDRPWYIQPVWVLYLFLKVWVALSVTVLLMRSYEVI